MELKIKKYSFLISLVISASVLLFALFIAINRDVVFQASRGEIFACTDANRVEKRYGAIVVLGAGLQADGSPSHMLEDRLKAAVELWKADSAERLILSGDRAGEHYDEVSAMEKYCLDAGVPADAIVCDYTGFSTYETVYNTVAMLGEKDIIVVTQKYHLYRALYLARRLGAQADGMCADYRTYRGQIFRDLREYVARAKDFFYVSLIPTENG